MPPVPQLPSLPLALNSHSTNVFILNIQANLPGIEHHDYDLLIDA
jgi:hypothetical protein